MYYVLGGLALAGLIVLAQAPNRRGPEPPGVETVAKQTTYHLKSLSEPHGPYKSDPPANGPHAENMAVPGFYEEPVPPERLIHNLEDGHVVIYYRPGLPDEVLADLRGLADRYPGDGRAVVVVPREDKDSAVILTAWRKILRLNSWDAARAQAFIDRYIGIDHHGE